MLHSVRVQNTMDAIKHSQQSIVSRFFTSQSMSGHVPNIRWRLIFISIVTYSVLSSMMLSHGAILLIKSDNGGDVSTLILAPSIFVVVSLLCEGVFRDAAESWGSKLETTKLAACGVLVSFVGVLICSCVKSAVWYSIIFGILCGAGTKLTLCQINFVLDELFYTNVGMIQLLTTLGESLGQISMPYVIMFILEMYGSQMGLSIVSCVVLQLLPIAFFIKLKNPTSHKTQSQLDVRARTYAIFGSTSSYGGLSRDIQLVEMTKSWRSPSDENIHRTFGENDDLGYPQVAEIVEEKNKTLGGVEILPQIVEESDDGESTSSEIMEIFTSKPEKNTANETRKYSTISTNSRTQENADNISRRISNYNPDDVKEIGYDALANRKKYENGFSCGIIKCFKSHCCCCCDTYELHRTKRRARNVVDSMKETIWEPAIVSFKTWQFYPALLIKICSNFVPLGIASVLPYHGRLLYPDMPTNEVLFFLTMHALGWLLFLCVSPWTVTIGKSKYKYFVIGGLFASSVGSFLIMGFKKYTCMLPSAFLIGLGQGAVSLTHMSALRNYIGMHKWSKIRDTIDRLSALAILALALWMREIIVHHRVAWCFGLFSGLCGVTGILLAIVPLIGGMKKRKITQLWPIVP